MIRSIRFLSLTITLASGMLQAQQLDRLKKDIVAGLDTVQGTFAVAFQDLTTGSELLINEKEMFHAASTMKTPVMIEVFAQVSAGRLKLSDSVDVRNEFKSIVDGSPYKLEMSDDSDDSMYKMIGSKCSIRDLVYQMITVSSNLATNMLIDLVGARNVTQRMRSLGANDIKVLRGVEDDKAFQQGLNNQTNAQDLMIIMRSIATGKAGDERACEAMMEILLAQHFKDIIPAGLPAEIKVAHKTGSITGVEHDSGIVLLPDGRRYILVLLSRGLKDAESGKRALARVSKQIFDEIFHELR